tara:strand:- start:100 stop:906 length:807 start_codon:yes stop_codon:yes gene_type:complete
MKVIKFLIIIPTLNSYNQLSKLIDLLEKQIYRDWKVIFVDGKSNIKHRNFLNKAIRNNDRFFYIDQNKTSNGIYGAMNDGIDLIDDSDFIMFWGSDDLPYNNNTFYDLKNDIINQDKYPDILLYTANYFKDLKDIIIRKSFFYFNNKKINNKFIKRSLFLGCSPAHQGTIYNSNLIRNKYKYNESYKIAADLDFFINIIYSNNNLSVFNSNKTLVCLGNSGVSNLFTKKRIKEVFKIYYKYYGGLFFIPFLLRYLKRFIARFTYLSRS